jgi:phosphoenolpyruvate carboxykinase (GTP)
LWPGYGENSRVLKWMCDRVDGKVGAVRTSIGLLPKPEDFDLAGVNVSEANLTELLRVDEDAWRAELPDLEKHFAQFGVCLSGRMRAQLVELKIRLG